MTTYKPLQVRLHLLGMLTELVHVRLCGPIFDYATQNFKMEPVKDVQICLCIYHCSVLPSAQESMLEEHDPRRWLVADKATLQRRLSHIEAKNDVRFLANKFRRENGHSVNPRDIVAAMAQRVRKERSDEESRQIIKDFLAQSRGKKMSKGNAVSHESLIANKKLSSLTNLANGTNDTSAPERTSSNEQLKKTQRRFFNRPRSRTQDSRPSSELGNEIPLLTFNETAVNESCREKQSTRNETPLILSSVNKLSGAGKIGGSPVVKKGILKRSSAEVIPPPKWLLSDLRASSSGQDSLPTDDENAKQSKSPSDREDQKKRANSSDDEGKLNDIRVVLATPENSDIEDDCLEICPKTKVQYTDKTTGGEIPYRALFSNNLERQQLARPTKITSPSVVTFTRSPVSASEGESTSPVITVQEPQDPEELFNTI